MVSAYSWAKEPRVTIKVRLLQPMNAIPPVLVRLFDRAMRLRPVQPFQINFKL